MQWLFYALKFGGSAITYSKLSVFRTEQVADLNTVYHKFAPQNLRERGARGHAPNTQATPAPVWAL